MIRRTACFRGRKGFTILELLVVISIIAVIATLATGAAVKAIQQVRNRRIETMARGLELALANYRAQENAWPFELSDFVQDRNDRTRYWIHGEDNVKAFKKMYNVSGGNKIGYLDAAAYLVTVGGRRSSLLAALEKGSSEASVGYPNPRNTSRFCYYCVCFNPLTDTVKVVRQDAKHQNAEGADFDCPNWNNQP
jgi:prepilin-type N-terminal cleavage/methylation domain-containing protein